MRRGDSRQRLRTPQGGTWRDAPGLTGVVLLHAALSLLYLTALPPFNWPDEPAHFNYVRRLAEGRGLDVMGDEAWAPAELERMKSHHFQNVGPEDPEFDRLRYEAHQPPLYYLLAAGVYRLLPRLEAVKLLNLALSCGVVVLTWAGARRLFPETPIVSWAAALFSALLPMRCFLAVSVSNGVAAELLFALWVLALGRGMSPAAVGAIIGCGLWTQSSLLLTLPLYAAWLALSPRKVPGGRAGHAATAVRSWAVAAAVGLLLWSPWVARNARVYGGGDPTRLVTGALDSDPAVRAAQGESRPRLQGTGPFGVGAFAYRLFNSFWGVFGWMEMYFGPSIQGFFALLTLVPILGWIRWPGRSSQSTADEARYRHLLLWLGLTALLFLTAVVLYSLRDYQPQGRYLLTASAAFACLYAAGVQRALRRWSGPWLALTSFGLLAVNLHGALHMVPWYLSR